MNPSVEKEPWRETFLLRFRNISLPKMIDRADRQVYGSLSHFRLDTATIVHNVAIFYGGMLSYQGFKLQPNWKKNSAENAARVMQQDILNELNEINLCSYCYIRSNEQERDDWFCLPCEPQHELVYAKAKGYPYWPAKASAPYSFYLFLDNVCFKINKNRFLKSVAIFTTFDFLDPNMRDWRLIKATQNRLIVTSIH